MIEKVFTDVCTANSCISVKNDSIFILENRGAGEKRGFHIYAYKPDTFEPVKTVYIDDKQRRTLLSRMEDCDLFLKNLNTYTFGYDKPPEGWKDEVYAGKGGARFISGWGNFFYLTIEDSSSLRFYIKDEKYKDIQTINLASGVSVPDFLTLSLGENEFEIIFFSRTYFMGKNLIEINVYRSKRQWWGF